MYRVILVDDEILVREAVKETMNWNGLGFELAGCFQHGVEAADFIRNHPVDVVMTDICMPYMDGLELSRIMFEHYPQIDIVILSGYDNFEYAKQAMKYRVSEYLLKPFSCAELTEVLQGLHEKLDQKWEEKRIKRKNKNLLRSQLVMDLIYGKQEMKELLPELASHEIHLEYPNYLVAVLDTEILGEQQQAGLLYFAVYNIADEIIRHSRLGIVVQKMDNRVIILLSLDCPKRRSKELERAFLAICSEAERCMGLHVTIGIGSLVNRLEDLHRSCEEAEDMLDYQYACGSGAVYHKTTVETAAFYIDWKELQTRLNEAVRDGEKEAVKTILQELFLKIRTSYLRSEWARNVVRNTLNSTKAMLEAAGMENLEIHSRVGEVLMEADRKKSLRDVMPVLLEFYEKAAGAFVEMKDKKGNERAVLVMEYIRSHYMDPAFNLQSACTYIAMSPSRFSAMLRQCTGQSFVEALADVRMEKARELLEDTDLKTYQIAEQVGFRDPHYFSLAFKKATGRTPTEYAREKRR